MDFSKIKAERAKAPEQTDDTPVEAIVKVNMANYVPKNVEVRRRIDEFMFTAETSTKTIDELKKDEKVVSVQASEKIQSLSPKPANPKETSVKKKGIQKASSSGSKRSKAAE